MKQADLYWLYSNAVNKCLNIEEANNEAMDRKLKLTYVVTHRIRWVAFEWAALYIDRTKFEMDFLILNETDPIIDFLKVNNIPYKTTNYLDFGNVPEVIKFIYDHLIANKTDVVHSHFFASDLVAMQAAYYAKVPVRVFTRHHSGIKWKRHARSKYELLWEMATDMIALNQQGKDIMLTDGVPEEKITIIPYGFDIKQFQNIAPERVEKLRNKYIPNHTGPVIGVMSRYIKIKGVEYIVDGFKEVLKRHPDALLFLAGTGTYAFSKGKEEQKGTYNPPAHAEFIQDRLKNTLPEGSYVEIPFENDLFALYKLYDVLVHVPIAWDAEAFGQVFMETMFSEVPAVITLASPAHDYAVHKENAWVVDFENSKEITEGILALLSDQPLRDKITSNALTVAKGYTIERKYRASEQLYMDRFNKQQK